jgi:hypothetical protein
LLPRLKRGEFDQLVTDIKKHGLREPITTYKGLILDGRNRQAACGLAGVTPHYREYKGDDPVSFVISANLHRRHLTSAQKRTLIGKLMKLHYKRSNTQIGAIAKADKKTVQAVREKLEGRGEIPRVMEREDTKGRQQPVTRRQPSQEEADRQRQGVEALAEATRKTEAARTQSPNARYPALLDAWHNASPDDQRRFLDHIGAAFIDLSTSAVEPDVTKALKTRDSAPL